MIHKATIFYYDINITIYTKDEKDDIITTLV